MSTNPPTSKKTNSTHNNNHQERQQTAAATSDDAISDKMISHWKDIQNNLAAKAAFSDSLCNFDPSALLGVTDYFSGTKDKFPSLASATSSAGDSKNDDDNNNNTNPHHSKFPPLRWVGGLDISFVKDTPIAVASLVVIDVQQKAAASASTEDQNKNTNNKTQNSKAKTANHHKDQNPFDVVYEDMLHCRMDIPYWPGFLGFREVDPLRQLITRIKERAPHFLPQVYFIDGNGLLHYRKCGCAVHFGVQEDVPIVGCAKAILAVDGLGRESTDKLVVAGTKDPALVPGTFTFMNTTLVPVRGPTSNFMYAFGALTGNSTAKPIYISPGHRLSHRLAAMLAVRLAPFRVVEPIRQADLRSRKYINDNFDMLMKENTNAAGATTAKTTATTSDDTAAKSN